MSAIYPYRMAPHRSILLKPFQAIVPLLFGCSVMIHSLAQEILIEDSIPPEIAEREEVWQLIRKLRILRTNVAKLGEKHPQMNTTREQILSIENQLSEIAQVELPKFQIRKSLADPKLLPKNTGKSMLSPNDFTYLGAVKLPLNSGGIRFGYSYGSTITTRRVNGKIHIFFCMSQAGEQVPAKLCELVYDQKPSKNLSSAKRLSIFKNWGDIYGNGRAIKDPNGIRHLGIHWDGEKLMWSWGPMYSGDHERSIGATEFIGETEFRSYGPWRTTCHAKQSNSYMTTIPIMYRPLFAGRNLLIGGTQTSINALSTWGHSLHAFSSENLRDLPQDSLTNNKSRSISTLEVMHANMRNKMVRNPTWQPCAKDPASEGYTCINPRLFPPSNLVSEIDTGYGCQWIDNIQKHGIVFVSSMVDKVNDRNYRADHYNGDELPHCWYATANSTCCHGHTAFFEGTGPHTSSYVPQLWIYNPQTLVDSIQGRITPLDAANSPDHKHCHLYEFHENIPKNVEMYAVGCAYEQQSRLLFIPIANQETNAQTEPLPIIHVFEVAN